LIKSYKLRTQVTNGLVYAVLAILSLVWLLPIAYLLLISFKEEPGPYTIGYLLPKAYTFTNYTRLFTDTAQFDYPRWFSNTLFVSVLSCIISTSFVLMVSYSLSRLRFKMRRPFMNISIILGLFPGFLSLIAIYNLLKLMNLTQSLAALVLVYSASSGLGYYITKGFFDTIPRALDEAALLDGATKWEIFVKLTLPMSKPIITYTVLTSFMGPWVDYILAGVIMKGDYKQFTIALGLYSMLERESINTYYTAFCAGAVLVSIPISILFIIMQRYYVEGVTGGAVKG
jgi:arabinogalactan oligomer/maltooligosaccharide transport system permease protein